MYVSPSTAGAVLTLPPAQASAARAACLDSDDSFQAWKAAPTSLGVLVGKWIAFSITLVVTLLGYWSGSEAGAVAAAAGAIAGGTAGATFLGCMGLLTEVLRGLPAGIDHTTPMVALGIVSGALGGAAVGFLACSAAASTFLALAGGSATLMLTIMALNAMASSRAMSTVA